jgi:hypothetical protein
MLLFNKRLHGIYNESERGEESAFGTANHQQSIIDFLGTTYLMINKLQQIAYEYQEDMLPNEGGRVDETFLLKEEILQCIESLSAKCLSQQAQIKLDTKCLPERLAGDLFKFRLALHSAVEFALLYAKEGFIEVVADFSGMTMGNQYLIAFDFTFSRNR